MSGRKETFLLFVKYGLSLLLLLLLQTSALPLFPFSVHPDLLLPAVIAVALIEGHGGGMLFALFAGLFGSALGEVGFSMLPLFYVTVAFLAGYLSEQFDAGRKWPVFALLNALFCAFGGLFTFFRIVATWTGYNPLDVLRNVIAPEFLATYLLSFPISLVFILLKGRKRTKKR